MRWSERDRENVRKNENERNKRIQTHVKTCILCIYEYMNATQTEIQRERKKERKRLRNNATITSASTAHDS